MAIAQLRRAQCRQGGGIGGHLGAAEGFEITRDGILVSAGQRRQCAQRAKREDGQHQVKTIHGHWSFLVPVGWQLWPPRSGLSSMRTRR